MKSGNIQDFQMPAGHPEERDKCNSQIGKYCPSYVARNVAERNTHCTMKSNTYGVAQHRATPTATGVTTATPLKGCVASVTRKGRLQRQEANGGQMMQEAMTLNEEKTADMRRLAAASGLVKDLKLAAFKYQARMIFELRERGIPECTATELVLGAAVHNAQILMGNKDTRDRLEATVDELERQIAGKKEKMQ